jgi:hypothetical protein
MNDQQLIDRGTSAQDLLNNDTFQRMSKELLDHYVATFLATSPDDEKTRSSAYFLSRALQDQIAVLQQWVYVKDNIVNKNIEEE